MTSLGRKSCMNSEAQSRPNAHSERWGAHGVPASGFVVVCGSVSQLRYKFRAVRRLIAVAPSVQVPSFIIASDHFQRFAVCSLLPRRRSLGQFRAVLGSLRSDRSAAQQAAGSD